MRLENTRAEYYFYSGKVSDIVRQLGLAGIAVIWLFKIETSNRQRIPDGLILPGILLLLGLATDLLQYAAGTIIWNRFNRKKEVELENKREMLQKEGKEYDPEMEDFTAPESINDVTIAFFWTKVALIILAYMIITFYLVTHMFG